MKQSNIAHFFHFSLLLAIGLLTGCATPPSKPVSTDAIWQSHLKTGKGAYERGDYRRAAEAYQRAAERGVVMDNPDAAAIATINWAASLLSENQIEKAYFSMQSLLIEPLILSPSIRADALTMTARTRLLLQDDLNATELIEKALAIPQISVTTRAQALCIWSALALKDEDSTAAAKRLHHHFSPSKWKQQSDAIQAEYYLALANITATNQQFLDATQYGEAAVDAYRSAGRFLDMANTLKKCGGWATAAGEYETAGTFYARAWASFVYQNQPEAAHDTFEANKTVLQNWENAVKKE